MSEIIQETNNNINIEWIVAKIVELYQNNLEEINKSRGGLFSNYGKIVFPDISFFFKDDLLVNDKFSHIKIWASVHICFWSVIRNVDYFLNSPLVFRGVILKKNNGLCFVEILPKIIKRILFYSEIEIKRQRILKDVSIFYDKVQEDDIWNEIINDILSPRWRNWRDFCINSSLEQVEQIACFFYEKKLDLAKMVSIWSAETTSHLFDYESSL